MTKVLTKITARIIINWPLTWLHQKNWEG